MRRRLIAGNWKMHGLRSDAQRLAETIVQGAATVERELLVCPPTTLLDAVSRVLDGSPVGLGAQDCHAAPSGAHTGDVSAEMLADLGCRYVIVGHSERRTDYGETDATVRAKAAAAHRAGLIAIVCVGESAEERDRGETLAVVARQLTGSLPENASPANSVVAYEPVWAIGTGRTASPGDIAEVHGALRGLLAGRASEASDTAILYGGSVKPGNAPEILSLADVDGALVGGASLNAESFLSIAAS